jgi:preprotein translocase subunit SecA
MEYKHAEVDALQDSDVATREDEQAFLAANQTITRGAPKVGRNDPCPCGSGKKFKQCHGKLDSGSR